MARFQGRVRVLDDALAGAQKRHGLVAKACCALMLDWQMSEFREADMV